VTLTTPILDLLFTSLTSDSELLGEVLPLLISARVGSLHHTLTKYGTIGLLDNLLRSSFITRYR